MSQLSSVEACDLFRELEDEARKNAWSVCSRREAFVRDLGRRSITASTSASAASSSSFATVAS